VPDADRLGDVMIVGEDVPMLRAPADRRLLPLRPDDASALAPARNLGLKVRHVAEPLVAGDGDRRDDGGLQDQHRNVRVAKIEDDLLGVDRFGAARLHEVGAPVDDERRQLAFVLAEIWELLVAELRDG
jgi:hypothetical protein